MKKVAHDKLVKEIQKAQTSTRRKQKKRLAKIARRKGWCKVHKASFGDSGYPFCPAC